MNQHVLMINYKYKAKFPFYLILIFLITLFTLITITINLNYEQLQEFNFITSKQQIDPYRKTIIFPNSFHLPDSKLKDYYIDTLQQTLDSNDVLIKNKVLFKPSIGGIPYSSQEIQLFNATNNNNNQECSESSSKIKVDISPAYNKNTNITRIIENFINENNSYYNELKPFFPEIENQLNQGIIEKYWFQLIGSSIWLKEYGINLMISRIVYSSKQNHGFPQFSLSYLQIYDNEWNELNNIELIVPTDNDGDDENKKFKIMKYPSISPIPIYHNIKDYSIGKPIGIEDPRIQLIKNEKGFEEPIIIFNSQHYKINKEKSKPGQELKYDKNRSIFIGWLWKNQKGKFNVEEISNSKYDNFEYIKIKHMELPNDEQSGVEKNWSLMINNQDRLTFGYDKYIYFVYQFLNLKILKCSLQDDDTTCEWEYKANESKEVGLFHGGTELININQIIEEDNNPNKQLMKLQQNIPKGREIWIGFARAVLLHCGCGSTMYRPNLVIIMKDKSNYKLAYVSSFSDLGIEVLPWYKNGKLCDVKNLIIPNGISSWTIDSNPKGNIIDTMSFTITRRDATVDLVFMKGLLTAVLFDSNMRLFEEDHENQIGFKSNHNINCALAESMNFCKKYGKLHKD